MKTRLEEVKSMQTRAMKGILQSYCPDSYEWEAMMDNIEVYVQLRIEQAMIEKGVVHG